jgi:hypothetical protein
VSYLLKVGYLRRFQMQADFSKNCGDLKFRHIFKRIWARQKHTAFVINSAQQGQERSTLAAPGGLE